jgi:hypothetical protein
VTSYVLYYSTTPAALKSINIFNLPLPSTITWQESSNGVFDLQNLVPETFYYLKLVTKRNINSVEYISASDLPILAIPVPGPNYYYNHALRIMVDKSTGPSPLTQPNSLSYCTALSYKPFLSGATKATIFKQLINTPVWENIITNPLNSDYGVMPVNLVSHWLGDTPVNLATTLKTLQGTPELLVGYSSINQSGGNQAGSIVYSKSCSTSSCDMAYRIVGGDGADLPAQGSFYTDIQNIMAYPRCFAYVPCTTNTNIPITSPSCGPL